MMPCQGKPDDKAITQDIQSKITADPATQDSQVSVESHEGNVTLRGRTRTVQAKRKTLSGAIDNVAL